MNRGSDVVVFDNLSSGRLENIVKWLDNSHFRFLKGDMLTPSEIRDAMDSCDVVFHLAANPDVRVGAVDTRVEYEQNILATYNLLETMRKSNNCKGIVFTSSSTVYGEASVIPTPESYGPLKPISLYGASKLACESLISGYAYMFDFKSVTCRLANIVGARSGHGVICDFIRKLKKNSKTLTVLGDGTQTKSYLYVDDCVEAMLTLAEKAQGQVEIYNIGSEDMVDVIKIAKTAIEEMGLDDVEISCTGGVNEGRGWKGDVKDMLLDVSKLKDLGWKPKHSSLEAVRLTIRNMLRKWDSEH